MSSLKYSDKAFLNYSFPRRRLSNHFDLPRNFPRNTNSSITQPLSSISIIAERPLEIFPSVQIIMRKKKRRRRKKKCQWEIYRFIRQGIRVFSHCSFDTYPFHTLFLPLRCKLERDKLEMLWQRLIDKGRAVSLGFSEKRYANLMRFLAIDPIFLKYLGKKQKELRFFLVKIICFSFIFLFFLSESDEFKFKFFHLNFTYVWSSSV